MTDISDSVRIQNDVTACEECGSTSRVGRGLCLNCLLHRGITDIESNEGLKEVLDEVDVRDADWRIGNYQILEEIGRGGMGVIYRARQRHSRRIVALKRILSFHADSRETLARFRREAEAAASLDHPNVLPIYEVSEGEDGLPFFSMKFAAGGSLVDAARSLREDPRRIVLLIAKATRGVQHAHLQGILHRDLKPGNILLDGRGEPLVSDFGLAKWLDTSSDLTRTLTIFGTPGYIAPEQAQGPAKNLTAAADIYSIGAVLFDLFTGRPPFLGEHALAVIKQASDKPAPKLRALAPSTDRDLETICARCLEREPTARYRSAGDLAEDLEHWLEGRPIIARPVSPPVRIWRWSKRNPKLAGSVAAAVILGAVGVITAFTSSRLSSIVQNAELARHSVAVTPFEDLDELSTGSNSATAATTALTTALTQTKGIRASNGKTQDVDPWSAGDWKKIGEAAGARFVLSGSVRQREGKKRVAVHLIETASGSAVATWLQDVDSYADAGRASVVKISNIMGIHNTAATVPASSLLMADGDVNEIGATKNSSARGYYERGKELFLRNNLPDLGPAIDAFRTAIDIDPNYAQPHAMLVSAFLVRSTTEPTGQWLEQAQTAAATAMRLAPMLPETQLANADNLWYHGHAKDSIDRFLSAYELDPRSARTAAKVATIYDHIGRPDKAIWWFEKATGREARPLYADNIGEAWTDLGDYDKAAQAFKAAGVFRPDLPGAPLGFARLALLRGDYENARRLCEEARAKYKDNPQPLMMAAVIEFFSRNFDAAGRLYREAISTLGRTGGVRFLGSVRFISALGFIQKSSGTHVEDGQALLEESRALEEKELAAAPENPILLYNLAADQAALGDSEAANAALNRAVEVGWIDYRSMELDPRFDSIRDTSAFKDTLIRLTNKVEEMRRQLPGRELATNPN
jgi:serine/threonine protein kinase/tetratricopeptide (TPR) repeat protein